MRPVTRLINHLFIKTMYLDAAKKQEIFSKYGKSNTDTGSAESQIALFSYRIARLTEHLTLPRHREGVGLAQVIRLLASRQKERDLHRFLFFLCPIRNLLYSARDKFVLGCLTG